MHRQPGQPVLHNMSVYVCLYALIIYTSSILILHIIMGQVSIQGAQTATLPQSNTKKLT